MELNVEEDLFLGTEALDSLLEALLESVLRSVLKLDLERLRISLRKEGAILFQGHP